MSRAAVVLDVAVRAAVAGARAVAAEAARVLSPERGRVLGAVAAVSARSLVTPRHEAAAARARVARRAHAGGDGDHGDGRHHGVAEAAVVALVGARAEIRRGVEISETGPVVTWNKIKA